MGGCSVLFSRGDAERKRSESGRRSDCVLFKRNESRTRRFLCGGLRWHWFLGMYHPGGVTASSRWLSAATPPVSPPTNVFAPRWVCQPVLFVPGTIPHGWHPFRMRSCLRGIVTGGVAALNHRLQAGMPPASKRQIGRLSRRVGASTVKRLTPYLASLHWGTAALLHSSRRDDSE